MIQASQLRMQFSQNSIIFLAIVRIVGYWLYIFSTLIYLAVHKIYKIIVVLVYMFKYIEYWYTKLKVNKKQIIHL